MIENSTIILQPKTHKRKNIINCDILLFFSFQSFLSSRKYTLDVRVIKTSGEDPAPSIKSPVLAAGSWEPFL